MERSLQKAATRDRIVRAVLDLLESDSPATISVPAVAQQAGVSLRTVYRYFPTKADLIHSASHSFDRPVTEALGEQPDDPGADLGAYLRNLWQEFGRDVAAVRAQHHSPAGREIRAARLVEFRRRVGRAVEATAPYLNPEEQADLRDLIIAVTSSSMFLELVDRQGHTPQKAAELAVRALGAIQNDVRAIRRERQ